MAEFWEDRLSLRYCFTLAERRRAETSVTHRLTWTRYINCGQYQIICGRKSCISTFTGEVCGGVVLLFSLFGGAGCLVFGHQVLWDSQGASADGQLKQSLGQRVTRHLQQEVLDVLEWKLKSD